MLESVWDGVVYVLSGAGWSISGLAFGYMTARAGQVLAAEHEVGWT